jgi:hypothetical protein
LNNWKTLAENCFWWYPYENICFVCDRPAVLNLDTEGRLHSHTAPAMAFSDGYTLYASHGVRVSEQVIMRPETLSVVDIQNERNAEVRRVMIERFGHKRYMRESGAQIIHQDEFGKLYRQNVKDDEPIVMIEVINATPEPDGSFKNYWLRVPPTMKTAHEAVAWTFGMSAKQYQPRFES